MNDPYAGMGPVERFDARNGSDSIALNSGWRLYSNGAMRENSAYGVMMPPPTKPVECCKLKVEYWETVYQRAADAFADAKHRLRRIVEFNRQNDYGAPDQSELKKVQDLQANAKAAKASLAKVRRELEKALPPEQRKNASDHGSSERLSRFEKTLGDLKI